MTKLERNKLPNFFIVGTAKAGTTSIGHYLNQHPDVYVSPIKEPFFFSADIRKENFRNEYRRSMAFDVNAYLRKHPLPQKPIAFIDDQLQYLELFREVKKEKVVGELSTGYLYSNCAAENIFNFNPDAKIVIILRQPVERAYSHYLMDLRGYAISGGFIDALERDFALKGKGWGKSNLYVELGLYSEQVSRYLKRFPENQVKIFLYEDLKNDTHGFVKALCEFIEVDMFTLSAQNVAEHKNIATLPIFKIPDAFFPFMNVLSSIVNKYLPDRIKAQIEEVLFSNKNIPKLRNDEFEHAMRYFKEDIQKLSVAIKRDLQNWHLYSN